LKRLYPEKALSLRRRSGLKRLYQRFYQRLYQGTIMFTLSRYWVDSWGLGENVGRKGFIVGISMRIWRE